MQINVDADLIFGEHSDQKEERIRKASPYGHFKTWRLMHCIIKVSDFGSTTIP